ncbi:MAG: zinc ribbon domain-containing protein [archaeon]
MTNCKNCNLEIKPDWVFCPYCGKFIETDGQIEIITTNNNPTRKVYRRLREDYFEVMEKIKKESPNAYNSWTKEEEQQLTTLYNQGKKVSEIATILERQVGGIRSRLKKIRLIKQ